MSLPFDELNKLLHREMDRQEFLRVFGAGILAVVGITGVINNLGKLGGQQQAASKLEGVKQPAGYGASAYGR